MLELAGLALLAILLGTGFSIYLHGRKRNRVRAKATARWEVGDCVTYYYHIVVVRKVARTHDWSSVLDEREVSSLSVGATPEEFLVWHTQALAEAQQMCTELNTSIEGR